MINNLILSDYVTLVVTVPEKNADTIREAIGKAGGGKLGKYSFCSFSTKGIGRFVSPESGFPTSTNERIFETIVEEKIETICPLEFLEWVIEAIKNAHPNQSAVIEIYPIYQNGFKFTA